MSTTASPCDSSALLLHVTPPRSLPSLFARPRLAANGEWLRNRPVIIVEAPAGFGKTSLLAQWRREFQTEGSAVAWLSAQDIDGPERFIKSLALAFRAGAGRPQFGQALFKGTSVQSTEGVTLWLAEIAQIALNTVLIVDQAERLSPESCDALTLSLEEFASKFACGRRFAESCQARDRRSHCLRALREGGAAATSVSS